MRQFVEDMRNGIPVKVAKTLLALKEWGQRRGVATAHELAERARLYRPWEGRANQKAFMKEARSLLEGGVAAQQSIATCPSVASPTKEGLRVQNS
jgi:hypothetical protein